MLQVHNVPFYGGEYLCEGGGEYLCEGGRVLGDCTKTKCAPWEE